MKKAFTFVLLPFFLFGIFGWQWMFLLKVQSIEMEEWNRTGDFDKLEKICITSENQHETFLINAHEILQNGKLYDVRFKEKNGAQIIYYCDRDMDEENILTSFENQTSDCFNQHQNQVPAQFQFLKLSVFEKEISFSLLNQSADCRKNVVSENGNFLSSVSIDSFFVPPDKA